MMPLGCSGQHARYTDAIIEPILDRHMYIRFAWKVGIDLHGRWESIYMGGNTHQGVPAALEQLGLRCSDCDFSCGSECWLQTAITSISCTHPDRIWKRVPIDPVPPQ